MAVRSNRTIRWRYSGAHPCTYLPVQWAACDALQQQIPPLNQWSSRYSAVPYRTRRTALDGQEISENVHYRIVSAQDRNDAALRADTSESALR